MYDDSPRSGFAETSDDEASSLGVFTRDHNHHNTSINDAKSEDAWTDRSSITPPFTSKKKESTIITSPTSNPDGNNNHGETSFLSVFSLESLGISGLFKT